MELTSVVGTEYVAEIETLFATLLNGYESVDTLTTLLNGYESVDTLTTLLNGYSGTTVS